MKSLRSIQPFWGLLALSFFTHIDLGYAVDRQDSLSLLGGFALLFLAYGLMIRFKPESWKIALLGAVCLRAALLFYEPNLSDDYYRFYWDGALLNQGVDPFLYKPAELPAEYLTASMQAVYDRLNSPGYHTVYPPLLQYSFSFAYLLSGGSLWAFVVVLKAICLLAEVTSLFLLLALLRKLDLGWSGLMLYAYNPLIIQEMSGNLHFEVLMIPFLLGGLWLFYEKRAWQSGVMLALAASVKLYPAILVPFFWRLKHPLRSLIISISALVSFLLVFSPFLSLGFVERLLSSIRLYFQSFEFNGSLYLLLKKALAPHLPYEQLQHLGTALGLGSLVMIGLLWLISMRMKKHLPAFLLLAIASYYLFATTVHPWYLAGMVALAPLSHFRFPILWSVLIPLTYLTYKDETYTQPILLIAIEYLAVYGLLIFELRSFILKRHEPKPA